jgi:RimJ/RimL family protein N-acetyltransferase
MDTLSGIRQVLSKVPKLELYESKVLATFESNGQTYTIRAGLSRDMADQLVSYAKDEHDEALNKNTHDRERFVEKGYDKWYLDKEPIPFALVDGEGKLAAIVWFSTSDMPEEVRMESDDAKQWDTIGVRSYGDFRGAGLMTPFLQFAFQMYARSRPGRSVWAITNKENGAMQHLLSKFSFAERGEARGRKVFTRE